MEIYSENILAAPTGSQITGVDTRQSRIRRSILNGKKLSTHKGLTQITLLLSDLVALCTVINILLIADMIDLLSLPSVRSVFTAFLLFPFAYTSFGLYKHIRLRPEREIFSFVKANMAVIAGLSVPVLFTAEFRIDMMLWLGVAAPLLLIIVPLYRVMARNLFSRASWWGSSALVIASREYGQSVVQELQRIPELGIKPAAILQDEDSYSNGSAVPVITGTHLYRTLIKTDPVYNVVLALDPVREQEFLQEHAENPVFREVFVARPNKVGRFSVRALPKSTPVPADFFRNKVTYSGKMALKRGMDVFGALFGLILLAPLFAAIAVLIKLTSQGPILYKQERMGKDGRLFKVYKFRTMHLNAEEKLQEMLANDPIVRQEYEIFHKLRNDPRITSVGHVLRRYSLDEFPQLLNVLKSEMSLVGPRAYIPRELPNMLGMEDEVLLRQPGLTGLWQVSGRNELSFEERVTIDVSYRDAWSLSLDYYILLKTIPVVLTGNGAA